MVITLCFGTSLSLELLLLLPDSLSLDKLFFPALVDSAVKCCLAPMVVGAGDPLQLEADFAATFMLVAPLPMVLGADDLVD